MGPAVGMVRGMGLVMAVGAPVGPAVGMGMPVGPAVAMIGGARGSGHGDGTAVGLVVGMGAMLVRPLGLACPRV